MLKELKGNAKDQKVSVKISTNATVNEYILLDVLVCSVAEYFHELCHILKSANGELKYKQRAADWLNRCSLQYKITNCPNNRRLSQDICTLFKCYLYSTQCGWIISVRILIKL